MERRQSLRFVRKPGRAGKATGVQAISRPKVELKRERREFENIVSRKNNETWLWTRGTVGTVCTIRLQKI